MFINFHILSSNLLLFHPLKFSNGLHHHSVPRRHQTPFPSTWADAPSFSGYVFPSWGCFESGAATSPCQVLHSPGRASSPDAPLCTCTSFAPAYPCPRSLRMWPWMTPTHLSTNRHIEGPPTWSELEAQAPPVLGGDFRGRESQQLFSNQLSGGRAGRS